MYLKRSMQLCLESICCGFSFGRPVGQTLLNNHLEKIVMFAEEDKLNADIIKDKKSMYRNHRLSREDKKSLYKLRPDLNLKSNSTNNDDDQDSVEEDVVVVSWDGDSDTASSVASCSLHSQTDLSSVVFAPMSPEREPKSRTKKIRPDTPKGPSRRHRPSQQDMEWDLEDPMLSPGGKDETDSSNTDEWLSNDPTQSLLDRNSGSGSSTGIESTTTFFAFLTLMCS